MYLYYFIFLLLLACSSESSQPRAENPIDTKDEVKLDFFEVPFYDSNLIFEFRTILSPINEIDIHSNVSDRIKSILIKQWQEVKQGDQLISYSSDKQSELELIIKQYENEKNKFSIAKSKYNDEEISIQEYENARTTYNLALKKYNAIKDIAILAAPFDGVISAIFIEKGKEVSIGQALFKIADIDTLRTVFFIDSEARKYISNKLIPEISINKEVLKGKIYKISKPQKSENYELHLYFANLEHKLNMRDTVSIRIDTKRKNEIILIPKNAVFVDGADTFVSLLSDTVNHNKIKVKVGNIIGEQIQVLRGIKPGDKVLLR